MAASFLRTAVSDLFGFQNTALEDQSAAATSSAAAAGANASAGVSTAQANEQNAQAAGIDYTEQGVRLQQAGDYAEAAQYGNAGEVAKNSAALADVAGQVQEYQNTRAVNQTVGSQRASVASAGFANSGSALALARSSFQQGYLTNQMTRMQTLTKEGGYLEDAAAAGAEGTAARTAGDIAGTTIGAYQTEQQAYRDAAAGAAGTAEGYKEQAAAYQKQASTYGTMSSQATVAATNLTNAVNSYTKVTDPNTLTPEDQLATSLISGNTQPTWTMNADGSVSYGSSNGTGKTFQGQPPTTGAAAQFASARDNSPYSYVSGGHLVQKVVI